MFAKWDIIYASKFPETIRCMNGKCGNEFSITKHACTHCGQENSVSNVIAKPRPIILWLDQASWFQSMTFGIPVSASGLMNVGRYNHLIALGDVHFIHKKQSFQRPMRAVIHQATRVDGNTLQQRELIGRITNEVTKGEIEEKLLSWIFS